MSIWGDILGGLETAGGIMGTPFTAGGSIPLITAGLGTLAGNLGQSGNTASNLSNVLGGAASGMAQQQNQQAALAAARANAGQSQYTDALNQALIKGMQAPLAGAQMAARGDVQSNLQDMQANFTPGSGYSFSGGLRPSDLGPNARQAGANLSQAGLNLQTNPNLPSVPNLTAGFPNTTPSALQQALQYGALGTGILGSFGNNQSPLIQIVQQLMKNSSPQVQPQGQSGAPYNPYTGDDSMDNG